jgi:hypothetical protein
MDDVCTAAKLVANICKIRLRVDRCSPSAPSKSHVMASFWKEKEISWRQICSMIVYRFIGPVSAIFGFHSKAFLDDWTKMHFCSLDMLRKFSDVVAHDPIVYIRQINSIFTNNE